MYLCKPAYCSTEQPNFEDELAMHAMVSALSVASRWANRLTYPRENLPQHPFTGPNFTQAEGECSKPIRVLLSLFQYCHRSGLVVCLLHLDINIAPPNYSHQITVWRRARATTKPVKGMARSRATKRYTLLRTCVC